MSQEAKLIRELTRTVDQVLFLLEEYPSTRNNDFYLQWMWLKVFGKINLPFIDWESIKANTGKLETVSRVRRKIQNEQGRFLPTDNVVLARRRKSKVFRKAIKKV